MAIKAYNNPINEAEVSIAIERLLVADYPQSFTPARVDFASLPTGFKDLGAVVEDTPSLKVTRSKFQLKTGIPRVIRYEAILEVEGTFEATFHSNSWRRIQMALGNYSASATSVTIASTIASVTNQNIVTLATTITTTAFFTGLQVSMYTSDINALDAIETRIASVLSDMRTLVFSPTPVYTPTVGQYLGKYGYVRQAYGTSRLREFALLGVADFIDGSQVLHSIPRCSSNSDITEEIRPGANQMMPLSFTMKGVASSNYGSSEELIVAERFYIPTAIGG